MAQSPAMDRGGVSVDGLPRPSEPSLPPLGQLHDLGRPSSPPASTVLCRPSQALPAGPHTLASVPTRRHWVIGDVHGCADALQLLVALLPARDRLVLCGDVINRGPRIEAAMELAWDLVLCGRAVWLMGNHEQKLVDLLHADGDHARDELAGCTTFRQLGASGCRRWLERLERLPLAHWGAGWVATHAGFDPHTWLPDLKVRMAFWQAYDGRFGEVIVGHTPGPDVRRLNDRITLIDTGACYGGTLTAYCPETREAVHVPGLPTASALLADPRLARQPQLT